MVPGRSGVGENGGMSDSDAPASDAQEMKDRGAFTRYRIMAFVTGGMLLLLCLEMLLKYVVQVNGFAEPVLGTWIAFVHGWIYVVYAVTVFDLWSRMRWSFGRIVVLIAGGVVPVLSFVMEQKAHGWTEETLADRRADQAPEA